MAACRVYIVFIYHLRCRWRDGGAAARFIAQKCLKRSLQVVRIYFFLVDDQARGPSGDTHQVRQPRKKQFYRATANISPKWTKFNVWNTRCTITSTAKFMFGESAICILSSARENNPGYFSKLQSWVISGPGASLVAHAPSPRCKVQCPEMFALRAPFS